MQKTAYEVRISDWSSDVCSSDLFGMARPEEYRKALRLMKMAEKFKLPIFTFIDTAGAYPGIGAEERNQSEAIARNLLEMAKLRKIVRASCRERVCQYV